eukprot:194496_1
MAQAEAKEEKKSSECPYSITIMPLPTSEDNYAHFLIDTNSNKCMLTDPPSTPAAIQVILNQWKQLQQKNDKLQLIAVLTTHHHWDHAGGIGAIKKEFKNIKVYGSKIDNQKLKGTNNEFTDEVSQGDILQLGNTKIKIIEVPCHTQGHLLYYVTDKDGNYSSCFTGDTLFKGGVGRFFEGTGAQMLSNFNKIRNLPKDCKLYNGHEYTKGNFDFGCFIEAKNEKMKQFHQIAVQKKYDLCNPTTVQDEIETNVFMRTNVDVTKNNLIAKWNEAVAAGKVSKNQKFDKESDVMSALRLLKNSGFHRK